jgi:NADH-quinone oxidoreductase subunit G
MEVMRVLPRLNDDVNEEWISDKTRFACDGLKRQRLDQPYVRRNGKLEPASWDEAFAAITEKVSGIQGTQIAAVAGDQADCESMLALKDLMNALGSPHIECRQDGAAIDPTNRAGYLFNSTIAGIDDADAIILIGTNPRWEAPIINARIRKRYLNGNVQIGVIGPSHDLNYKHTYLGEGPSTLQELVSGQHSFADVLKNAERPMLILGMGALTRSDGAAVLAAARTLADQSGMISDDWNGFNVLHTAASRVGGLELGFVPAKNGRDLNGIYESATGGGLDVIYLLGADEIDMARLGNAFVIYQGHHGDAGANRADIILPGAAYSEKNATYVNTEGRVQRTRLAVFPPGEAREDWKIIRALSEKLGKALPYNVIEQVRERLAQVNANFNDALDATVLSSWGPFGKEGPLDNTPFVSPIRNFYMTDPISRASQTMAKCTETFLKQTEQTGTHG